MPGSQVLSHPSHVSGPKAFLLVVIAIRSRLRGLVGLQWFQVSICVSPEKQSVAQANPLDNRKEKTSKVYTVFHMIKLLILNELWKQ